MLGYISLDDIVAGFIIETRIFNFLTPHNSIHSLKKKKKKKSSSAGLDAKSNKIQQKRKYY